MQAENWGHKIVDVKHRNTDTTKPLRIRVPFHTSTLLDKHIIVICHHGHVPGRIDKRLSVADHLCSDQVLGIDSGIYLWMTNSQDTNI